MSVKKLLLMFQHTFGIEQRVAQLKYMVSNLSTTQKSESSQFAKESKRLEMEQTTLLMEHTTIRSLMLPFRFLWKQMMQISLMIAMHWKQCISIATQKHNLKYRQ